MVGQELSIASSFVKQYYTLLNKAPCYIHNFYSQDSTFIHGTVDIGNENYTKPIVGREEIKRKMEELKLNDCRAKIKQIDCLETLAGGLVIQVIGELSDNGKPMREFLQTFVLAPSPDDSIKSSTNGNINKNNNNQQGESGDSKNYARANHDVNNDSSTISASSRNAECNNTSNPSQNQKFYVLNSIFRYPVEEKITEEKPITQETATATTTTITTTTSTATVTNDEKYTEDESPVEVPKKLAEDEPSQVEDKSPASQGSTKSTQQAVATPNPPQPSIEHKTWANAVRNTNPSTPQSQINCTKSSNDQQQSQANQSSPNVLSQQQNVHNKSQNNSNNNNNNNNSNNTNNNNNNNNTNSNPNINSSNNTNNNNNNSNNNNNGGSRRRVLRKSTNKPSTGRSVKRDRPRPPAASATAAAPAPAASAPAPSVKPNV